MRIPLRRDRAHIVCVNMMTDAHGLCLPGPRSNRNQRKRDRRRNNRISGLSCTAGPAGMRCKLHAVTSGLYGVYSRDYAVEWKLRRILPMGWHADAGADKPSLTQALPRRNKPSMTVRRTPADGGVPGDPAGA